MSDLIDGFLQENLLVLLCFSEASAPIIVNSLDPGLFENDVYKTVAIQAIDYYKTYKTPCKEHIVELLEPQLNDPKTEKTYARTVMSLHETSTSVNEKFTLSQLNKFIKGQKLKTSVIEAANSIKNGDLDGAQSILANAGRDEITTFDPGILFTDTSKSLKFLSDEIDPIPTGIAPFDAMKFGPAPGELMVILAPPNRGKTFGMVHLGSTAVRLGYKVLHLSLEMSEEKMCRRYVQNLFSMSTSKNSGKVARFERDEMNRFSNVIFQNWERPVIDYSSESREEIAAKIRMFKERWKFYVKRFPTNGLSIKGLEVYLDSMARYLNYTPELLMLDYADLMEISGANIRIDTGIVYKELRRIAVERNIAIVTASQTNRLAEDAKVITVKHLSEDYSKAATADNIFAYCQTSAEQKLGLARLFIAKARDEEREQSVLISQSYRFGKFCVDAILMNDNRYWDVLKSNSPEESKPVRKKMDIKRRD